jgi:outer membrane protein assembly factor BamB
MLIDYLCRMDSMVTRLLMIGLVLLTFMTSISMAAPNWSTKFDGKVRFYQSTELGTLIVGTEKSLYGVDAETGAILWRRKNARLDENEVAPIPGTDLLLISLEQGDKTRVEATDLLTGNRIWQSDKVRGAVMQMAVDIEANLLAVVFVKDAKGRAREGFKRKPILYLFNLSNGDDLWKRELESEVEMMPTRWIEGSDEDVPYVLANYRPPFFLDGRLYLFYEGVTSLDVRSGKDRIRDKFKVNEEGLALTEADPIYDNQFIYMSGRGRVRAVSRSTGKVEWESQDLGLTPELFLVGNVLYARTGGQFTRLKDGEIVERGSYGVSAIDIKNGKTIWRYKGADKGITNLAMPDSSTILIADRDDLIFIDASTGKVRTKSSHKIERAAFLLMNEPGQAVVGGRNELVAFDLSTNKQLWRARHTPPGRGIFRTVFAIAARATSLYFRYGGLATTAFRGVQLARAANSLRFSGLTTRVSTSSLSTLASNSAREYVSSRFTSFGLASRLNQSGTAFRTTGTPSTSSVPSVDVDERLLDRLDPANQLDKLSRFLMRRQRLAALHGEWMYFYTDLKNGNGLAGVNINTGRTDRAIRLSDPDERFITDETTGLLYSSKDNRLSAYGMTY